MDAIDIIKKRIEELEEQGNQLYMTLGYYERINSKKEELISILRQLENQI